MEREVCLCVGIILKLLSVIIDSGSIPDKHLECLDWNMGVNGSFLLLLRRLTPNTLLAILGFQYIPNVSLIMETEPALKQLWPR